MNEFKRWVPSLRAVCLIGDKDARVSTRRFTGVCHKLAFGCVEFSWSPFFNDKVFQKALNILVLKMENANVGNYEGENAIQ